MKKLDTIFSRYIRLRDTDAYGKGKCFTCGCDVTYFNAECGHFRSRRHESTRWHPNNAHIQCIECNHGDSMVQYIIAMEEKHPDEVNDLVALSNQSVKLTKDDKERIYQHYKKLVKDLISDKMFTINL